MSDSTAVSEYSGLDPNLALKQFFKDSDWRFKTGLGAVINASSFLLLVMNPVLLPLSFCLWSVVAGYELRVIRVRIKDANAPMPEWNDWLDLMISGLTWLAVYCGQLLFLTSIGTVALLIGGATGSRHATSNDFDFWVLSSLGLIYSSTVFTALLAQLLMTNLAEEERASAAFALRKAIRRFMQCPLQFIEVYLLSIGIRAVAIIVPSILLVGVFFIPMTLFMATCLEGVMLAQVWTRAGELLEQAEKPEQAAEAAS